MARGLGLTVRTLGRVDYHAAWTAMREFTATRGAATPDEIWLLEHPPVYTMGLKGRHGPLPSPLGIPCVATDRGGDITYHGPGQVVAYVLLDLARRGRGVKWLVAALEQSVIDLLAAHGVDARRRPGAPGVYVDERKIASLGLRVRQGRSYHGLALNAAMDLAPFRHIDPCGYRNLAVTQLADLGIAAAPAEAGRALLEHLAGHLGYNAGARPAALDPTLAPSPLHG